MTESPEEFAGDVATVVVRAYAPGAIYNEAYCIESAISKRGTTGVYRASDMTTGRRVVLKVLTLAEKSEADALERFQREADILMSLSLPNVVSAYEAGRAQDGSYFLAMESLEGMTLADRLRTERYLQFDEVMRLFEPVAEALDRVHERGVVHRDLKPANLFLPKGADVPIKILDFGLSSLSGGAKLTQTGMAIGSPNYMSPEQLTSAKNAGPAADRYALATCVYEALSGQSPYGPLDRAQMLGAITHGRIVPIAGVVPQLASLDAVFSRALARDPNERFPTASAFLTELRLARDAAPASRADRPLDSHAFKGAAVVSAPRSTYTRERPSFAGSAAPAPGPVVATPRARHSSWPWILLGAVLVLGAAALGVFLLR